MTRINMGTRMVPGAGEAVGLTHRQGFWGRFWSPRNPFSALEEEAVLLQRERSKLEEDSPCSTFYPSFDLLNPAEEEHLLVLGGMLEGVHWDALQSELEAK